MLPPKAVPILLALLASTPALPAAAVPAVDGLLAPDALLGTAWSVRHRGYLGYDFGLDVAVTATGAIVAANEEYGWGPDNVVLRKHLPDGTTAWSATVPLYYLTDVDVAPLGDIAVTGLYPATLVVYDKDGALKWSYEPASGGWGSTGLGAGYDALGNLVYAATQGSEVLLAKFDPAGAMVWERRHPTGQAYPRTMSVGPEGSVVLGAEVPEGWYGRAAMVRYDPDGAHAWTRALPVGLWSGLNGVEARADGILASGWAYMPETGIDLLVARLDLQGSVVWATTHDHGGWEEYGARLATDTLGTTFVGGYIDQGCAYIPLFAKLSAAGQVLWTRVGSALVDGILGAVAVDAAGNPVTLGTENDGYSQGIALRRFLDATPDAAPPGVPGAPPPLPLPPLPLPPPPVPSPP